MKKIRFRGFTLIELLVVISIIGVLMTLLIVTIGPIQRKSRDSRRKADVNLYLSGLDLFKADFKIYPNSTMYLGDYGTSANGGGNSNFSLSGDIPACNGLTNGGTNNFISQGSSPDTAYLNANPVTLKPGWAATNHFLICLKYMDRVVSDSTFIAPAQDGYQYRVAYDYSDALVSAKLENLADPDFKTLFDATAPKRYYQGSGVNVRQLDEDSNTPKNDSASLFYSALAGTNSDGLYLYQCLKKASDGSDINKDDRSLSTYDPITYQGTVWKFNASCSNTSAGLDVKQAY